ncbi:hypothetical protein ACSFB2_13175, partial [Glaesserella parasuis]|uniref:hypothetical protein n=1 Tax=Glaesserella parasuis TaxID=738 RepID=UPI003F2A2E34
NYSAPYPSYVYRFVRPAAKQCYITVNVANLSTLPANYVQQVQQAVAAAFLNGYSTADGTINVSRARIGAQIIAAAYLPIVSTLTDITPISIFIAFTSAPSSGAAV